MFTCRIDPHCREHGRWRSENGGFLGVRAFSPGRFGNDFQQPSENEAFRHFHMSTISTPYGGPACPEYGRPAEAVGGLVRPLRAKSAEIPHRAAEPHASFSSAD